jgi:hypothetical protein
MSTHVVGVVPPGESWKKMKSVWDSCKAVVVPIPDQVLEFFNHTQPDSEGVIIDLVDKSIAIPWRVNDSEGYELEVKKIPAHITKIRFYNSW